MRDRMFNQRDIESYFSELKSQLGTANPTQRAGEGRARQIDFSHATRRRTDLGISFGSRHAWKYSDEELVVAQGSLAKLALWNSGRGIDRRSNVSKIYFKAVAARAMRDMRSRRKVAAIRSYF